MALIIANRVKETSTTTGTGAFTLAGAMTGFSAFSSRMTSPSDTCFYTIQAVDANGAPTGDWECGLGTYSAANTLTRTTVKQSSNSDAAVSFSAGTKQVWIDLEASQLSRIGTEQEATSGSVSLTTGTNTNFISMSLPPGDWEVFGNNYFTVSGGASPSAYLAGINTVSATLGAIPTYALTEYAAIGINAGSTLEAPPVRINITTTTTVYMVGLCNFTAGSVSVQSVIRARRYSVAT